MDGRAFGGDGTTLLQRLWELSVGARASRRYAAALTASLAIVLLRIALNPWWGDELPYVLYYPVTLFVSLYAGFGPAIAGAALTGLATWIWVLPPIGALFPVHSLAAAGLTVYFLVASVIAAMGARHRALVNEYQAVSKAIAEQAARERERSALLEAVLDTSPSPIWIATDPGCERVVGNAVAHAILYARAEAGATTQFVRHGVPVPVDHLPLQRAARHGAMVRGEEYEVMRADGARTWLLLQASPLRRHDDVTGAVAVGVDITERKAAERQLALELDAMQQLQRLSTVLTTPDSTEALCLETAVDVAMAIARSQKAHLQVLDPTAGRMVIAAHRGFSRSCLEFFATIDVRDDSACAAAMRERTQIVVADVGDSALFAGQASQRVLLDDGIRGLQTTPLIASSGRVVGLVSTHFTSPWSGDAPVMHRMTLLARQVADYLERSWSLATLQRTAERDAYWVSLADLLRVTSDDRAIQIAAARLLGEHLHADRCYFAEVDAAGQQITIDAEYRAAASAPAAGRYPLPESGAAAFTTLRAAHTFVLGDTQAAGGLVPRERATLARHDTRAIVEVPLIRGARLVAIVGVASGTPRSWDPQEVALIEESAERVWTAIDALRTATRLRDSEARFRMISDAVPNLVFVNDSMGRNSFVNRAFCEFTGREASALLGDGWMDLIHPDDLPAASERWDRARGRGEVSVCEYRMRRHDGVWRWLLVRAVPQLDGDTIRLWIGTATDVTSLRETHDTLRDADRRKDEFLAVLAHELRNPLAPIRTGLELLRIERDSGQAIQRLRPMLERQVAHMSRLIDDLLEVSRITLGKIQLQREPSLLSELVRNAVDANRAAIDGADQQLTIDLPEAPCRLDVDPTRFVQVIANLLHNATKFTPRGGAINVVARVDRAAGAPRLNLVVRDSGIGIAPETLPRVFDLFAQGDHTGVARSGLGIGLALARQVVEMHGGRIDAHSDGRDRGSAFTIQMPVLEAADVTADGLQTIAAPPSGRRVLVIDDNADAADTLAAFISALGGDTAVAYDGEHGLLQASRFRPEMILLDLGMPGIDGYETCRRLRANTDRDRPSIIAVTGWGQPQDRERAIACGFDAHLTKPADPRLIEQLLADPPRQWRPS